MRATRSLGMSAALLLVAACGGEEASAPERASEDRPEARPAVTREPREPRSVVAAAPARPAERSTQPPEPVAAAIDVLRDRTSSPDAREDAVRRLVALGADAVPTLTRLLDDPNLARWALKAIAALGADAEPALPAVFALALRNDSEGSGDLAFGTLLDLGAPARAFVVRALEDPAVDVRRRAIDALRARNVLDPALVTALAARTRDETPRVREDAIVALGERQDAPDVAVPALLAVLTDPASEERVLAAKSISALGEKAASAVPTLTALLADRDGDVRVAAITALGRIGPSAAAAVPRLVELASREPAWTPHVVWALGEVAPDRLAEMLRGDDPSLRREIARWAAEHDSTSPALRAAWEQAVNDPVPEIRVVAIRGASRESVSAETAARIRESLSFPDPEVRREAADALGRATAPSNELVRALAEALRDEDEQVRENAAEALGKLRTLPAVALPALVAALDDPEAIVAASAATAIGRWGKDAVNAVPDLRRCLGREEPWPQFRAAEALCAIDPTNEALAAVIAFLRHANSTIRREAVVSLGATRRPEAIPDLVTRLDDGDREVRVAAAKTLASFGTAAASAAPTLERMTTSRDASIVEAAREALAVIRPK